MNGSSIHGMRTQWLRLTVHFCRISAFGRADTTLALFMPSAVAALFFFLLLLFRLLDANHDVTSYGEGTFAGLSELTFL